MSRQPNHRGPDLMEVRRLWSHGMTDDQIAASMGISTRSAQRARLKAGLRRPKGRHADAAPGGHTAPATYYPLSGQEADTAIRLYLDGRTDKEIAGELHRGVARVGRWRNLLGLKPNRKRPEPKPPRPDYTLPAAAVEARARAAGLSYGQYQARLYEAAGRPRYRKIKVPDLGTKGGKIV